MRSCLLEQSGMVPDRLAIARRTACLIRGWGHFRLNWNPSTWGEEHADATLEDGKTWAEGRSLLFEKARREAYDYYLFLDDDVLIRPRRRFPKLFANCWRAFEPDLSDASMVTDFLASLAAIERVWRLQCPVSGNLFSATDWAHQWHAYPYTLGRRTRSFCIACHDLQTHFFRADYAALVFPAPVAGSAGSMWYAQFAGAYGWPKAQVCISSVEAFNTRCAPHQDHTLSQFKNADEIHRVLQPVIRHESWSDWNRKVLKSSSGIEKNRAHYMALQPSVAAPDRVRIAWDELVDEAALDELRKSTWGRGETDLDRI